MPLTAFSDGRVMGERSGARPRVLALHGWRRSRRDFAPVLDGYEALAVDLPGFGASPPPDEPWGSAEYAAAMVPVLATFDEPPVVVGHSFGGRVAVQLAARHPELVRALVLTGVPLLRGAGRRPSLGYRMVRELHRRGMVPDSYMERVRSRRGSDDYRAASGVMRDVLVRTVNESYEDQLAALRCPVELVWGEADTAAPVEMARRAAALAPTARLTVCEGADHISCLRHPALREAIARHCP